MHRKLSVYLASIIASCVLAATSAPFANAATCTINGIARECDFNCPGGGGSTCNPEKSHANCDDDGDADGYCVICGTSSAEFIIATSGDDWICAKGGNDEVWTYDIFSSSDSVVNGDDTVDASSGNDIIHSAAGDDDLQGGTGNDDIEDYAGANAIDGGANDDVIAQITATGSTPGSHFCGGEGNDRIDINVTNYGLVCIDCGDGQSATGTDYDVEFYNFAPNPNETGSALNCVNPGPSSDLFTPAIPCGCKS